MPTHEKDNEQKKFFSSIKKRFNEKHKDNWKLPRWTVLKTSYSAFAERNREHYFFDRSIRPIFLKYLLKAYPEVSGQLFNDENLNRMKDGKNPQGWTIHHQKPLLLGGKHMQGSFYNDIRKQALPEGTSLSSEETFKIQLDSYLAQKEKEGTLKQTMNGIFSGYIVLIPHNLHEALENDIIEPQKDNIFQNFGKHTFYLSVPYWFGLINDGKTSDEKQKSKKKNGYIETKPYTKTKREIIKKQKEKRNNTRGSQEHLDRLAGKVHKRKKEREEIERRKRDARYYGDY